MKKRPGCDGPRVPWFVDVQIQSGSGSILMNIDPVAIRHGNLPASDPEWMGHVYPKENKKPDGSTDIEKVVEKIFSYKPLICEDRSHETLDWQKHPGKIRAT